MNRDTPTTPPLSDRAHLAHLSHTLRTALAVARGYAELTARYLRRPEPDLRALMEMNAKLHAQLLRLEAVIREGLDRD